MSEKSHIISIFEGYEKKERKKGAQKKGGENSPISPPLGPRLKLLLGPQVIQLVWYIVKPLFTPVSTVVVDI